MLINKLSMNKQSYNKYLNFKYFNELFSEENQISKIYFGKIR